MIILPSLEIVPAKYNTSTNTLLSQIPIDGTGDFTVTRATSPTTNQSTRVNALGLIETVPDNVPRLDYPIGGGCPALLVEPSAQNTFIESQTLFTTHFPLNLTTTGYTNAATSPDGSVTAEKFVPTTASGVHGIANGSFLAIASGTTYTLSLFVKSDGGPYNLISLTFDNSTAWGATRNCIFNASNGTNFAVPSGATMTSENYGNGWYRIRATLTAVGNVAAAQYQYRIYVADASGNLSWAAPSGNTNGVFCWGAQLETGSVATSYIPTVASGITRAADVITDTTASGVIGQTEGTIYMEVAVYSANKEIFSISSGSVNGEAIRIQTNADGRLGAIALVSSSQVITTSSINVLNLGQFYKVAFAYKLNDYTLYIDGVVQTLTNVTGGVPVNMNKAVFARPNDSFIQDQRVRATALYPTRLTDTQLALLTSPYTSYSSMASALSYTLG